MIVKNITGEARYFGFGRATFVRGRLLEDQATYTLPDNDPVVMAAVQGYVAQGFMSIVEGPQDAALLASTNIPANGWVQINGVTLAHETVTVAGQVFEFAADPGSAVLGEYNSNLTLTTSVWAGVAAAASASATSLAAAINHLTDDLGVVAGTPVLWDTGKYVIPLFATDGTVSYTGLTLAKSGVNLVVSGTTFATGVQGPGRKTLFTSRTITAADVTLTYVLITTGWNSVSNAIVSARASTGIPKAWTGALVLSGGTIMLDGGNLAADDVFSIFAQE